MLRALTNLTGLKSYVQLETQVRLTILYYSCVLNQVILYTRCIMPKRVASLRGPTPRHCAR